MKNAFAIVWVAFYSFFSASLPAAETKENCPQGWMAINTTCIHVSNITVSWADAKNKCKGRENSSLIVIEDERKNYQIVEILKNITSTNGSDEEFYIGLSIKKERPIQFKWIDGTPFNYSNWRSPAPNVTNNTFPSDENTLCVFYGADFKWLLKGCETQRRFICQLNFSHPGPEGNSSNRTISSSSPPSSFPPRPRPHPRPLSSSPPPSSSSSPPPSSSSSSSSSFPSSVQTTGRTRSLSSVVTRISQTTPVTGDEASLKLQQSLNSFTSKTKSNLTVQDVFNLVEEIERAGKKLIENMKKAGNITQPTIVEVSNENLVIGVAVLPPGSNSTVEFPSNRSRGNIALPNSVIAIAEKFEGNSDGVGITSVFLPGLGKDENDVLNSGIISTKLDVPSGTMQNLSEPVVISLPHAKKLKDNEKPSCGFIDESTKAWSTAGCHVFSSNSSFTVCSCSHLTSFAVLLDVHDTHAKMPEKHQFALLVVSIVGCCIALVCFVAALIAFYLTGSERRRRKTETVAIHKNLAIAEIFALVFFLIAYGVIDSKGVCFAVAFLLHYFLMAVFLWMLVEGINLHRGLVQVFVTSSRMKIYHVLGWVIPLPFVVITAAVGRMKYVREDFCWISYRFMWVFAGPVVVIIFINFIILCIAIRVMIKRPRYKMNKIEDSNKSNIEQELRIALKTTVILLPLLGLTWCLGFIVTHSTDGNIVIQYVFAIVNSLQGLYFFFAHCVYDEDVITVTSNTSTRIKSYFSRTLSNSGQSGRSGSLSNTKRTSAYCNASYDDRVLEMPCFNFDMSRKKGSANLKEISSSAKTNVVVNGNTPNGIPHGHQSPVKVISTSDNVDPVPGIPIKIKKSAVGFDAYFGSEEVSASNLSTGRQPERRASEDKDLGSPSQQFFRRANSSIVKLSSRNDFPRRAYSLNEHYGTRRPLSKQTSSDSNQSGNSIQSGNSNTPILFSGY